MKTSVLDKQERLVLGSTYELRGNFEEQISEDGEVSYCCDMYRTKDSTTTFTELNEASIRAEKIDFLAASNYISINRSDLTDEEKIIFDAKKSDRFGLTNGDVIKLRKQYVEEI